jgi:methionine-rich copper-binding protein CopC
MRLKRTLLLAGGVAVVAAIVTATVALAHSRPVRFDPAPGSVLTEAPTQVKGWFTNDIRRDPNWSFIRVTDANGNVVSMGEPILSDDRRQMTVALQAGMGPGIYSVTWRTWDDLDGAIFGQCYNFFVGQAAADAAYTNKTRIDVGGKCDSIDVEAENGTPVPGVTPTEAPAETAEASATTPAIVTPTPVTEEPASGDNGGVSAWVLIVGIAGGLGVGVVGGRFLWPRG